LGSVTGWGSLTGRDNQTGLCRVTGLGYAFQGGRGPPWAGRVLPRAAVTGLGWAGDDPAESCLDVCSHTAKASAGGRSGHQRDYSAGHGGILSYR
jgi:hypothetical protein